MKNKTYKPNDKVLMLDGGIINGQPKGEWLPAIVIGVVTTGDYVGDYAVRYADTDDAEWIDCIAPANYLKPINN